MKSFWDVIWCCSRNIFFAWSVKVSYLRIFFSSQIRRKSVKVLLDTVHSVKRCLFSKLQQVYCWRHQQLPAATPAEKTKHLSPPCLVSSSKMLCYGYVWIHGCMVYLTHHKNQEIKCKCYILCTMKFYQQKSCNNFGVGLLYLPKYPKNGRYIYTP